MHRSSAVLARTREEVQSETMLSGFKALAVAGALALQALARQVPIVDGVVGGVRSSKSKVNVDASITPAATTPGKLRVTENSGVCETTTGVYQASGYGDLTSSESIWYGGLQHVYFSRSSDVSDSVDRFWFFAARENPDTAPLAIWLNGGVSDRLCFVQTPFLTLWWQPGSSSMIGLFQENGPCRINNDSETVSLNKNSWNNVANMSVDCANSLMHMALIFPSIYLGCTLINLWESASPMAPRM